MTATTCSESRPKKSASSPHVRWHEGNSPRLSSAASAHSDESSAITEGSERRRAERAPALLGEELRQRLAQELDVEIGRVLDASGRQQPVAELGVQLLAAREPRLLQVGRRLKARCRARARREADAGPGGRCGVRGDEAWTAESSWMVGVGDAGS